MNTETTTTSGAEGQPDTDQESGNEIEDGSENATPPAQFQGIIKSETLKTVIKTLRVNVDETRIFIDEDGFSVTVVDAANVAMDELRLAQSAFESYTATAGMIAVDLDRLWDIVTMANKGDLVQFAFDQKTGTLVIHIGNIEVSMACLDPDALRSDPDDPDIDVPVEVVVDKSAIDRGVTAADMVSDTVTVAISDGTFVIESEGDTDSVEQTVDSDDLEVMNSEDADSIYALDYMKGIVRTIPNDGSVTVEFGTDFPIILSYELADGHGQVTRMLAPRIRSG